jgi:hypothetical protein
MNKLIINKSSYLTFFLSLVFAFTIQQLFLYQGNALHLIHSIKYFANNNLNEDWIANQTNHLPLYSFLNYVLIKFFSPFIIYLIHFILLVVCSFSLFSINKIIFPRLENKLLMVLWFSIFIFIFHEHSLFAGVAGQSVINEGQQPASFGVLFFTSIYFYLIRKYYLSILLICLAASIHPTYIIHSGFLVCGYILYFFSSKNFNTALKVTLLYGILILPITIYVVLNFLFIDSEIVALGHKILMERIPHHADINHWFNIKDFIFIFTYIISLYLVKNNLKFFIPFLVIGCSSISLSLIQFYTNNLSLAFLFPWRTSVFINPISSLIILSFIINKIESKKFGLNYISYFLFIFVSVFFIFKSHFIKNNNLDFENQLLLVNKIKSRSDNIDRILIPINIDFIRMNTGIPIFINRKHHAFKMNEIIEWKKRLILAENFYNKKDIVGKKRLLNEIDSIENISHILINKKNIMINCKNLIDDENYLLLEYDSCFK